MRPPATSQHTRRRIAGLLLGGLLLLLAQSLGLLHGYSHGHGAASVALTPAVSADDLAAHGHRAPGLFDGHEDDSAECRLFDQLLHADSLLTDATALAEPPAAAPPQPSRHGVRLASQAAGYLARGPPAG
ncbi:conserved hypothetical protein [Rubrivivax sp. A210]|uniref:hypothetical protein n=1 Tax=Rubrivivax sp. A210 TaxID=2772301 RepID=UPI0019182D42|nr:hypothetical protein [Rubrivivax sp. A210]CAD5372418.1 conserved hypothetical protein [Rubrivivax sp. A210]